MMATTISPARFIDRLQFASECAAVRDRAMRQLQDRQAQRQAYVEKWIGYVPVHATKPEPVASKVKAVRAKPRNANPRLMKRSALPISYQGQSHTLKEWAKQLGIKYDTLVQRVRTRGSIEAALAFVPAKRHGKTYEFDGKHLSLSQWAELAGINPATLKDRVGQYSWSIERALTQPVINRNGELVYRGYQTTSQDTHRTGGVSTVRDIHHSVVHENAGMTP